MVALVIALIAGALAFGPSTPVVEAGVFFNDTPYTYKEYWASHSTYTAGCGTHSTAGDSWYIEPEQGCTKEIDLQIPDDVSGAIAAVIYVDIWRNRANNTARFTVNDGPQFRPSLGDNFSRNPFSATLPLDGRSSEM